MQIDLNEEEVKRAFEEELVKIIHRAVREIINRWGFDSKVKSIVDPIIEETIDRVAREEIEKIDAIRERVRVKIESKIDRQLKAVMKAAADSS